MPVDLNALFTLLLMKNLNRIMKFCWGRFRYSRDGLLCSKAHSTLLVAILEKKGNMRPKFFPSYFSNFEVKTTGEPRQILFQCF